MSVLSIFVLSVLIGYAIFVYFCDPFSFPRSRRSRLPKIAYKNIEILPYFRIHIRKKTYHIHHWLTLTLITGISFFFFDGISHLVLVKGVALGGIVQGLRYPDRFKFRHPRFN